ncbi:MAG: hypothetical protein JXA50_01630 [Deltaproteobacteria bacterium]|nr:hypothetical protein [Deltaproteobacteria bacterium]
MNETVKTGAIAIAEVEAQVTSHEMVKDLIRTVSSLEQEKVLAVRTVAQHDEYNNTYLNIKATLKLIKQIREEIVAPFNKQVKCVNAYFKKLTVKLSPKATELERVLLKWRRDQEEKERERLRKLKEEQDKQQADYEREAEMAAGKGEEPPPPPPKVVLIKPRMPNVQAGSKGASHSYTDWEVTVLDMKALAKAAAEGKVPVTVLDYKLKPLKDLAKAGIELPGCKVEEVQKLKGRTS